MKKIFFKIIFLLFLIFSICYLIKYNKIFSVIPNFLQYSKENAIENMETKTIEKVYNILDVSEPNASKIMKDFVYKDLEKNVNDQVELNRLKELVKSFPVKAFEYDLNDDGVNEIIGLPPQIIYYFGPWGGSIIFLKKNNGIYERIEDQILYTYEDKIVIFKEKTNGYHHMQFKKKGQSESKHLIKYDKNQKSFKFYFFEGLDK